MKAKIVEMLPKRLAHKMVRRLPKTLMEAFLGFFDSPQEGPSLRQEGLKDPQNHTNLSSYKKINRI